jgi:hypothetical protein
MVLFSCREKLNSSKNPPSRQGDETIMTQTFTPVTSHSLALERVIAQDLEQHIEDDLLVTRIVNGHSHVVRYNDLPPAERPTRWNAWEMHQQTYCCRHWWNGDTCLYGNHRLK